MKVAGKALLGLIQVILMIFGLISIMYAVYMWMREKLELRERMMFDDFESDFPSPSR